MSLSSLMHHPHQSDPVKLRKRSLWFAFASSCALLQSCSQSDSARAKAAKIIEAFSLHHLRCSYSPAQEPRKHSGPGTAVIVSKPAIARRGNAGLLEEI